MLEEIKLFFGVNDNLQDALLELIIEETKQRVLAYLNKNRAEKLSEAPEELSFIIRDVCIKRFNKRNSEGAVADSEEGRSYTWESSYLAEYKEILEGYWDKVEGTGGDGIARFL